MVCYCGAKAGGGLAVQRYFLDETVADYRESPILMAGEQYHHMIRVMRMKVGEKVYLVFPNQTSFVAEITEIGEEQLSLKWIEDEQKEKELPLSVTIASGLPKGDKLEWIVQKGTELGAARFIPFEGEFSIAKWNGKKSLKKIERLNKIAQEAAEQSHRVSVPEVCSLHTFDQLLEASKHYDACLVAYEESAKNGEKGNLLRTLKKLEPGDTLLVLFGPEGGLSKIEIDQLTENGFLPCALGPRILRTETAPLYVLSAISYEFELDS